MAPQTSRRLTIFLGIGFNQQVIEESLRGWKKTEDILDSVRKD
jgi:hypothetical protein